MPILVPVRSVSSRADEVLGRWVKASGRSIEAGVGGDVDVADKNRKAV